MVTKTQQSQEQINKIILKKKPFLDSIYVLTDILTEEG